MNPPPTAARSASRSRRLWFDRALMLNAMALVLAPWATVKLILLALLLAGAASRLDVGVFWTASQVRMALLALGLAALVVSPYWAIAPTTPLRLLGLGANALIVGLWARSAASDFHIHPGRMSPAPWLVAAGMLVLSGPGIFGPLEFRGDEDVHVTRPLRLLEALGTAAPEHGVLCAAGLTLATLAFVAASPVSRFFRVSVLCLVPIVTSAFFLIRPPAPEMLLRLARYPILGTLIETSLAFSPLHALPGSAGVIHEEALYRLASFGSALALALLTARVVKGSTLFRVATALMVAGIPNLVYFSGVDYPDLIAGVLAVPGLLAVCVWARRRRSGPLEGGAWTRPPALALLTKESLLPALGATALGAVLVTVWRRPASSGTAVVRAAFRLVWLLLTPIMIYMFWRFLAEQVLGGGRPLRGGGFGLDGGGALVNPVLARILVTAVLQEFGPLSLLAAVPLLFGRRRRILTILCLAPMLIQLLLLSMNVVDSTEWGPLPRFAGLARFHLTLLPGLVCLSLFALRDLWARSRALAWAIVSLGLAWNLSARPVSLDGSPEPRWGDYVVETSGERYPYDALYAWIAGEPIKEDLTIVGRDYPFRDDFYLRRHGLGIRVVSPISAVPRSRLVLGGGPDHAALLASHNEALKGASQARGLVVLHVSSWLDQAELPDSIGPIRRARSFCRGRYCLIVYRGSPQGGAPAPRAE